MRFAASCMTGLMSLVLMCTGLTSQSSADTLDDIKAKGKISIGVKSDSRPWGFLDPQGNGIGMEIDLAKDVADRLGVDLELVVVQSSNRIQFLEQGRVDLLIATMYDTEERRRVIDMVQPHYYSAATSVLSPKSAGLKEWSELEGKPVCGQQGSVYNRWIEQTHGAQAMSLPTIEEAYAALRAGNCVGFVYNDLLLQMATDEDQWADYEVALPSEDRQYHSIGIRKGEAESEFGEAVSEIVTDWHRTGKLIELNKEWGIPDNEYLEQAHAKYGD
jgi:polar amino acid transport system substrate-binding protein